MWTAISYPFDEIWSTTISSYYVLYIVPYVYWNIIITIGFIGPNYQLSSAAFAS